MALTEMTTELLKLKLAKRQNQEELEDKIAAIENEYRCTIGESMEKSFVVKAGGAHYADVIQSELLYKGAHTNTGDLIKAISKCWQIAGGGDIGDTDDDSVQSNCHETALVGTNDQRNVNIECYNEERSLCKGLPQQEKKGELRRWCHGVLQRRQMGI